MNAVMTIFMVTLGVSVASVMVAIVVVSVALAFGV